MTIEAARTILAPLLAAIIGGLVVHLGTRRRDVENERRRQRIDYLVGAYRTLVRAAHRDLRGDRGVAFEDAISDVVMLGTGEQIRLASDVIRALADNREAPVDALLVSLRNALRQELGLSSDTLRHVPAVRMNWTADDSGPMPLKLGDASEVSFDEVAATTGAAVASASDKIVLGEQTEPSVLLTDRTNEVNVLRELAQMAPGAAVVTAYGHVTTALRDLITEQDEEPAAGDAPYLARLAMERGLVSAQLVETVRGLAILKDVGLRGGSGTGLSVEQATEYIDLVAAALYVLRNARP